MEELNRRNAVVHVHPTAANCCRNLDYAPASHRAAWSTAPTPRARSSAWPSAATPRRYPDIRFIWSHAGGTAPFLAGRIEGASRGAEDRLPDGFTARSSASTTTWPAPTNNGAVASLLQLVTPSQVLFGTDFPPGGTSAEYVEGAGRSWACSDAAGLRAVERDNAVRLLPRLGLNTALVFGSAVQAPAGSSGRPRAQSLEPSACSFPPSIFRTAASSSSCRARSSPSRPPTPSRGSRSSRASRACS